VIVNPYFKLKTNNDDAQSSRPLIRRERPGSLVFFLFFLNTEVKKRHGVGSRVIPRAWRRRDLVAIRVTEVWY